MNKELEALRKQIDEARELYYSTGKSPLSDSQYDKLVDRAVALGYIEKVGSKPVDNIPTIKHDHPMLSLDKVHTVDEITKFAADHEVLYMYKADGMACGATYIDGVLKRLETRGNGMVGNDIMLHAKSITNLPLTIEKEGKYVIDGEVVILKDDFNAINTSGEYSNPRNLVAGSLNQLDPAVSATRRLRFYAWDVIEGGKWDYLGSNLAEAHDFGFDVVLCAMKYENESVAEMLTWMRKRADSEGFPIDGVVIKYDDIEYGKSLGATDHHPKSAIAYKYDDQKYETKLTDVEWTVGKSGQITPIAIFEPVDMEGVIVNKASLHNISVMDELGITMGCTINVCRANDVIPQVDSADYDGNEEITIPNHCPACNAPTKIVQQNSSKVLYCTNPHCQGKLLGKLTHYVSRQGMDIDGLSEQTLKVLIKIGAVNNFVDLYNLRTWKDRLIQLPGFGAKSVNKLFDNIDKSAANVDLAHFICALSIPNIGTGQAKVLAKKFKTWDALVEAVKNNYDFTQLVGFGNVANDSIHDWFDSQDDIAILVSHLVFYNGSPDNASSTDIRNDSVLGGKVFVITGKLIHFNNREQLVNLIQANGGNVAASVTKNTNFLINNDAASGSSKNKKAKELGIKIITEDEFLNMVKGQA